MKKRVGTFLVEVLLVLVILSLVAAIVQAPPPPPPPPPPVPDVDGDAAGTGQQGGGSTSGGGWTNTYRGALQDTPGARVVPPAPVYVAPVPPPAPVYEQPSYQQPVYQPPVQEVQQESVEEEPSYIVPIAVGSGLVVIVAGVLVWLLMRKPKSVAVPDSVKFYITSNLRNGYSPDQIRAVLVGSGWPADTVQQALMAVQIGKVR